MKITEYPQVTAFDDGDFLLKDGTNGTKIIKASNAANEFFNLVVDPQMHANIYRGKSLGTSFTAAQKAAIADGSFKDMFIGDYWTIGGKVYRVADMDYFYNTGSPAFTKHHLVVVPDKTMYNNVMKSAGTTEGGYVNSDMRLTGLASAKTTITSAFGSDAVLTHKEYLVNAVTNGKPSGKSFTDASVEIMNEIMVFGTRIYAVGNDGTASTPLYTLSTKQFSLFRLNPKMIHTQEYYWLRDVVSSFSFAYVPNVGGANSCSAPSPGGVRPYFCIG